MQQCTYPDASIPVDWTDMRNAGLCSSAPTLMPASLLIGQTCVMQAYETPTLMPASLLASATPMSASRFTLAVCALPNDDRYSTLS